MPNYTLKPSNQRLLFLVDVCLLFLFIFLPTLLFLFLFFPYFEKYILKFFLE